MPLALDFHSEPEPDIAVVKGNPRDFRKQHPTHAVLIVEIADSSLSYDRERKKRLYARNAIEEYWIVNLIDCQLEFIEILKENPIYMRKSFFLIKLFLPCCVYTRQ